MNVIDVFVRHQHTSQYVASAGAIGTGIIRTRFGGSPSAKCGSTYTVTFSDRRTNPLQPRYQTASPFCSAASASRVTNQSSQVE